MSTTCCTCIIVTGSQEDISLFRQACFVNDHEDFDFNRVIRMPVAMARAISAEASEMEKKILEKAKSRTTAPGEFCQVTVVTDDGPVKLNSEEASGIFGLDCHATKASAAWSKENWGGFTNAYDCELRVGQPGRCEFDFFTKDVPAEKVFEVMIKQFPALNFEIGGRLDDEDDDAFGVSRFVFRHGKVILQQRTDLDAEIRERLKPDMSKEKRRELAEWCAIQKDLFAPDDWLEEIERNIREHTAQAAESAVAEAH